MPIENWQISKPVIRAAKGVVAAQNWRAAQAGAEVLTAGGNAVDAAVATACALAVAEPWMSGLGGCGYMVVYGAEDEAVRVVDFGTVAPLNLDPATYPLGSEAGADGDLFGWPGVEGARNVRGPLSLGVPGSVAGLGLALARFGSLPWAEVLAPAVELAEQGHIVDWWTTLLVARDAAALRENEAAAAVYLPDGLPPVATEIGKLKLDLGRLAATLRRLAEAGPEDFYRGAVAETLVADVAALGGVLSAEDLAGYEARVVEPLAVDRGDVRIHLPPGLTAGPSFADALDALGPVAEGAPGPEAFAAYARALTEAYRRRLAEIGHDGDQAGQGCTTQVSVADARGNLVALTNTLLSPFGAKVVSPGTGVLLNNGIMWFDPRPGRPNSIAPGKRPLCNMCPLVATRDGRPWFALGGSGGRRILPAVFQVASFLIDCGLPLEAAVRQPRINVDGGPEVEVDPRLGDAVAKSIAEALPVRLVEAVLTPNHYANPVIALREGEACLGATQLPSPVAAAIGAR
ncbi:MAG: gamma-glutamyltransferase [Kiloniellales bacterium]|nr:gamma-glutamyltransferase [Kiloniellales bacterium]